MKLYKNIAMSITEYRSEDYMDIIHTFKTFVLDSQFNVVSKSMDALEFSEGYGYPKHLPSLPESIPYGTVLYGVRDDRTLIKLRSILDSSD